MTVTAAIEKLGVIGSASAASSVTIESFEWKPVWVGTATVFLSRGFDTGFDWASGVGGRVEVAVVVSVGFVGDLGSGDQESKQVINEDTLDGAGSGGARVTLVGVPAGLVSFWALSGAWKVIDFPRNAGFTFVFTVDHCALVAVGESFTETVDLVHRGTFTSSNVVVKVAPASVLVESFNRGLDVAGESSERRVLDLS